MTRTATALLALASATLALPAAAEEIKFMAELSGAAQVPPVETEAMGMADVTVDTEAMTVSWRLVYEGLSGEPVAAHFHGPATPEETAPPTVDLTVDLEACEIRGPDGGAIPFELDAFRRHCLLNGLDDIGLTLEKAPAIAAFEDRLAQRAWS